MALLSSETARIAAFRRLMQTIRLGNSAYRLTQHGKRFQVEYLVPITVHQREQAEELLRQTLNKEVTT